MLVRNNEIDRRIANRKDYSDLLPKGGKRPARNVINHPLPHEAYGRIDSAPPHLPFFRYPPLVQDLRNRSLLPPFSQFAPPTHHQASRS